MTASKIREVFLVLLLLLMAGTLSFFAIQWMQVTDDLEREKSEHLAAIRQLSEESKQKIETEEQAKQRALVSEAQAEFRAKKAEEKVEAERRQLLALSEMNDHLVAWMTLSQNKDFKQLKASKSLRKKLIEEYRQFLKSTENKDQYQKIRARIKLQLGELELQEHHPSKAETLLDEAVDELKKQQLYDDSTEYCIFRARVICLLQAIEKNQKDLVNRVLPKVKASLKNKPSKSSLENQRFEAVVNVIDARLLQAKSPGKSLAYYLSAIQKEQTIYEKLKDNVVLREELAKYRIEAAELADALSKFDVAKKLRADAVLELKKLLKKSPDLDSAKLQLAHLYLLSALSNIDEGRDVEGGRFLSLADKLLIDLPENDLSLNGSAMLKSVSLGLHAMLLRDAGKTSEAKRHYERAIELMERVVQGQQMAGEANDESRYQLAVLHWQFAGMIGDAGDKTAELKQGEKAAEQIDQLLQRGAGVHERGMRRALAYLYGDLGHTSAEQGKKEQAVKYFDLATKTWQAMIERYGNQKEFTDGLKWSRARKNEVEEK